MKAAIVLEDTKYLTEVILIDDKVKIKIGSYNEFTLRPDDVRNLARDIKKILPLIPEAENKTEDKSSDDSINLDNIPF